MPKIADLPSLDGLDGSETVVVEKGDTTGRASFNDYLDAAPAVPAKQRPGGGPAHIFADRYGFHRSYIDQEGRFCAGRASLGHDCLNLGPDFILRSVPRADFLSASLDRYGFLAGVRTPSGLPAPLPGNVSARRVRRSDFLHAWGDRFGFLKNIQRPTGEMIGRTAGIDHDAMNARALAAAALRRNIDTLEIAGPVADWNVVLSYGQSLSSGWEAWPALTTNTAMTSALGLYMLGNSDHPQSEDATEWLPFGAAQLNPLAATVSKDGALLDAAAQAALTPGDGATGETPGIAATLTARKMWLAHVGSVDDGRKWIHASCGVGGRTIEQLSRGASPNLFNRLVDFVTRLKALADAQGTSIRIVSVLYLGNEYNANIGYGGTTDRDTYIALHEQLRADVQTHVVSIVGQSERPAWIEYQIGGAFTSDDSGFGVQMAALDLIDRNRTNLFGSQPTFAVTDKRAHLDPNGARWLGCLMGRALGHVLTRRRAFWPLTPFEAVRSGREIIVSHLVPAPPLVWTGAWRWTGYAQEHSLYPHKGFALIDGAGVVPISSVEIMRDTLVRIVAARDLTGTVQVRLGGQAAYAGNHNLFDSDPAVLPLAYEYSAGNGQYAAANIPELIGKPYPAQAAAYAYQITVNSI